MLLSRSVQLRTAHCSVWVTWFEKTPQDSFSKATPQVRQGLGGGTRAADKGAEFGCSHKDPSFLLVELEYMDQKGALGHQLIQPFLKQVGRQDQRRCVALSRTPSRIQPNDVHSERFPST